MDKSKSKNSLEYGDKPNRFLYSLVSELSKLFLKIKYNIKIDNKAVEELKHPFIALGNHASKLDPFIMASALYPHRVNFLGTNYYFRNPVLRPLFKRGGVIPKVQFYRDITAVRAMNRVISSGGSLGIFPEGRRSIDGSPSEISIAIAKLIKLYRVPVIAIVANGAYLSLPRWSLFSRRGKIDVTVKPVLTTEEVENLSLEEIHRIVKESIYFNDYDWNRKNRISFNHKRIAEKIDSILHECPSCKRENAMLSKENLLYCRHCNNTAIMDEYCLMRPKDKTSIIFEDAVKWYEWQRARTLERLVIDDFEISSKVRELWVAEGLTGAYRKIGYGEIRLTKEGLDFKGVINGKPEGRFFSPNLLSSIVSELGVNFEITDGKNTWRFDLEDGQDAVRYELAVEGFNKLTRG